MWGEKENNLKYFIAHFDHLARNLVHKTNKKIKNYDTIQFVPLDNLPPNVPVVLKVVLLETPGCWEALLVADPPTTNSTTNTDKHPICYVLQRNNLESLGLFWTNIYTFLMHFPI